MKRLIKSMLRNLAYRLGHHNLDPLTFLLETRLRKSGEIVLIQIGANDGKTYDPLHDFVMRHRGHVRGLMLEPVADFHEQLVATYAQVPGITPLRLAIHETERSMEIYRLDPSRIDAAPGFAKGIASFDPAYHLKSETPSEWIIAERVDCIPLRELVERHGMTKLDLLCIDTEGYDAAIVESLDFEVVRPVILMFEHGLRDGVMAPEVLARLIFKLNAHRYDVVVQNYDVVAHQRDLLAH